MEASKYMQQNPWGFVGGGGGDSSDSESKVSSSSDDSITSEGSFSSSSTDLQEDASSQGNKGPLYELSELMAHLPIKRGLSLHFQGKSQSFTALSHVRSIEDLVKRENPYRKKMKPCKSYGGLDGHTNKSYTPKAKISKKASRGSTFWSSLGKRSNPNHSPRSPFSLINNF